MKNKYVDTGRVCVCLYMCACVWACTCVYVYVCVCDGVHVRVYVGVCVEREWGGELLGYCWVRLNGLSSIECPSEVITKNSRSVK